MGTKKQDKFLGSLWLSIEESERDPVNPMSTLRAAVWATVIMASVGSTVMFVVVSILGAGR